MDEDEEYSPPRLTFLDFLGIGVGVLIVIGVCYLVGGAFASIL